MKNKILLAVVFVFPFGLFFYFWLHPVAEKETAPGENRSAQTVGWSNAPAPAHSQMTPNNASNAAVPPQSL